MKYCGFTVDSLPLLGRKQIPPGIFLPPRRCFPPNDLTRSLILSNLNFYTSFFDVL